MGVIYNFLCDNTWVFCYALAVLALWAGPKLYVAIERRLRNG